MIEWAGLDVAPEAWYALFLVLSIAVWPVMVWCGIQWGRMQVEDEYDRLNQH